MTSAGNAHMTAGSSLGTCPEFSDEVERWLPVPDFPDYEVSDQGRIRTLRGRQPRVMKLAPGSSGYLATVLTARDGSRQSVRAHALVLTTFVGPRPSPEHQARHLDGDQTNNALANLAWGTRVENSSDKRRHGTMAVGERNGKAKLTAELVLRARHLARMGVPVSHIAQAKGLGKSALWQAVVGETWGHLPGALPKSTYKTCSRPGGSHQDQIGVAA